MGLFDQFPYTNFHELNLMWILEALKEIKTTTEQFVAINSLKYANPIQWNITSQYEKNTIVIDPQTGTAYISVQPVPTGVSLTNADYWTVVFDLGSFVTRAAKNFTTRWEEDTTLTATFNSVAGDWLVWGDTLYIANVNITAGDSYVVDGNIRRITIEEIKNEIYTTFNTMIGDLANLSTTDKSNLVAAINEIVANIGDLDDLTTTDKSNLVAAINEVASQVLGKIGDLDDLSTTDKSNLVAAINEINDAISDEITARADADTALQDDIDNIINRKGFVNVLDYGAIGDGVTDDTEAIQSALNTGKNVYIPARSVFLVTDTLYLTQRDQSVFSTPTLSEFPSPTTGCIITSGMEKPIFESSYKCSFYNLHLWARNDGVDAYLANTTAIKINMVDTVGSVDSLVRNCRFYLFQNAIAVYGRQINVTDCLFMRCNNCLGVYYTSGSGTGQQGDTYGGRGIKFIRNHMHHEQYGVVIYSGNIRGAIISDNLWDINGAICRVQEGATLKYSTISNNVILFGTWTPIAVMDDAGFQYNIVANNIFEYDPDNVAAHTLFGGNRIVTGCAIINNLIANTTSTGIAITDCSSVAIIGNIFKNVGTAINCQSGNINGISVIGNIVNGNIVFRAPSAATLNYVVVKGNTGTYTTYYDGNFHDGGTNSLENRITIANLSADPTMNDFNTLLQALRNAGILQH